MSTTDENRVRRRTWVTGAVAALAVALVALLLLGTPAGRSLVAGWALVALVGGLAGGLVGAVVVAGLGGRDARRRSPGLPSNGAPAGAAPPAAEVLDDLPGFLEHPPGSAGARPIAPENSPPVAAAPAGATEPGRGTGPGPGAVATAALLVAVVALVTSLLAVAGRGPGLPRTAAGATGTTAPTRAPATTSPDPAGDGTPSATATTTPAAALALESVPLGGDGVTASATFAGVVLEQRAVGVTVTYPSVSVSTDGDRALAHVRLPTWNCLTGDPPADPLAAGCARSLTEYAELTDPQLQVSREDGGLDVAGLFPTYTRPNGSAPAYTGRAYQLAASLTAEGPAVDGRAPATGTVRIGLDLAPVAADAGVNLLQFPG